MVNKSHVHEALVQLLQDLKKDNDTLAKMGRLFIHARDIDELEDGIFKIKVGVIVSDLVRVILGDLHCACDDEISRISRLSRTKGEGDDPTFLYQPLVRDKRV